MPLPDGIQREILQSSARTGMTLQLKHASFAIQEWFSHGPHWFETVAAHAYQRMDAPSAAQTFEEVEECEFTE